MVKFDSTIIINQILIVMSKFSYICSEYGINFAKEREEDIPDEYFCPIRLNISSHGWIHLYVLRSDGMLEIITKNIICGEIFITWNEKFIKLISEKTLIDKKKLTKCMTIDGDSILDELNDKFTILTEIRSIKKFISFLIKVTEWTTKNHKLFPKQTKQEIETILLLSQFKSSRSTPIHPNSLLSTLPKEIKFEVIKFIAT
jgi:hypothetical protein